ncbi:hypothetical protein ACH5RR_015974 [Cinchona calisaya]|uniref:Uncharacterized protein n=1 Tax=Cinchona calisaya TaxID=153742 RepID=A0ABD2ZY27_9GENT
MSHGPTFVYSKIDVVSVDGEPSCLNEVVGDEASEKSIINSSSSEPSAEKVGVGQFIEAIVATGFVEKVSSSCGSQAGTKRRKNQTVYVPTGFARGYLTGYPCLVNVRASDGCNWVFETIENDCRILRLGNGWQVIDEE